MRKILFVFLSVLLIALTSCKNSVTNIGENAANIVLTLKSEAAREAFGPEPIDIADIQKWSLKFTDEENPENIIIKENLVVQDGKLSEYVPEGTYTITVTGELTITETSGITLDGEAEEENSTSYKYVVGEIKNVDITQGEQTQKTVIVGYGEKETGSLDFTFIDLSRTVSSGDFSNEKYIFKLSPIGESDEILISTDEIQVSTPNFWQLKSILTDMSDSEKELYEESKFYKKFTISKSAIPSGNYYIHIIYENEPLEFAYNIVQIRDNQTSSVVDYSSKSRGVKTFYITNQDFGYNGQTSDYPINIDDALTWLANNPDEWKEANLNFETSPEPETNEFEKFKAKTPKINVGLLKAAVDNTKTIKFYVDGKELGTYAYSESDEKTQLDLTYGFLSDLYFYTDSESTQTIDLFTPIDINRNICLENTRITYNSSGNGMDTVIHTYISSNLATDDTACSSPIVDYTPVFEDEGVVMDLIVLNTNGEYVENPLYIYKQVSSVQGGKYNEKYYTVIGGEGTVSISEKIPNFSLKTESGVNKATISNDATKINVALKEGESFIAGTTYKWYLNNQEVASGTVTGTDTDDLSYSLDFVNNAHSVIGKNTISFIAEYDGVLRSSSMNFILKAPVEWMNMLWTTEYNEETHSYTNDIKYGMFKESEIETPDFSNSFLSINKNDETVVDFAYDEYGNVYVSTKESESDAGKITRFNYKNGNYSSEGTIIYEYSESDNVSDVKLYGDITNNILYFSMSKPDSEITRKFSVVKIEDPNLLTGKVEPNNKEGSVAKLYTQAYGQVEGKTIADIVVVQAELTTSSGNGFELVYFGINNVGTDGTNSIDIDVNPLLTSSYSLRNTSIISSVDGVKAEFSEPYLPNYLAQAVKAGEASASTSIARIVDMTADEDGNIYFLVNENTETSSEFEPFTINSRGGVIKMDKMGGIIQWNGTTDVLGWDSTAEIEVKSGGGSQVFGSVVQPSGYDNYFLGPRKFIAIKPEKLVIADDGCFIDETNLKVRNKNRIITVDLETGTFESVKDTSAKFMFEATGYSCYHAE